MTATDATAETDLDAAMTTIAELAEGIGSRRPTGAGEEAAADALIDRLGAAGVDAATERFDGYSTFAAPFGLILGVAAAPALLPRSRPVLRSALSWLAVAGLLTEGSLRWAPLSALLSRRPSRNVVATIEPAGEAARTVCLVAHMDTSRSGLIFAPGLVRFMPAWIAASGGLVLLQALLEPFATVSRHVRRFAAAVRGGLLACLGLLAEREIRGADVPGANDNASGCGVVVALASPLHDRW